MSDQVGITSASDEPDFYIDGTGLSVFTTGFHLRRGTCCGNKCRHCPYDWRDVPPRSIRPDERPTSSLAITARTGRR